MQREMSGRGQRVLRVAWLGAAATACVSACATGVDVTDAELAQICSDPTISCPDDISSGGSAPTGTGGTSGSGTGGSLSGTGGAGGTQSFGGTGGTSSTGTGGTAGTGGSFTGGTGGTGGTTSTGTGGTAGSPPISGGTCTNAVAPVATGGCATTNAASIVYTDRTNGAASNNQLSMTLGLENAGASFDLTDLVIRYWFTADGQSGFIGEVDYASLEGGNGALKDSICVNFGDQLGSQFADIGFTGGGTVGPAGIEQIQLRVHSQNYGAMDQSNDFSFVASAAAVANENVAVYVGGTLVGGCEPGG